MRSKCIPGVQVTNYQLSKCSTINVSVMKLAKLDLYSFLGQAGVQGNFTESNWNFLVELNVSTENASEPWWQQCTILAGLGVWSRITNTFRNPLFWPSSPSYSDHLLDAPFLTEGTRIRRIRAQILLAHSSKSVWHSIFAHATISWYTSSVFDQSSFQALQFPALLRNYAESARIYVENTRNWDETWMCFIRLLKNTSACIL